MTPLVTALAGLVLGVIAVPLLINSGPFAFVPFVALVALLGLRRDSRAAGGGFLVAFSGWWVYIVRQAVERCDAFNRNGGSCTIYGTTEQVTLAVCVALVGTALIAVAFRDRVVRPV
jgi:hypothetical protein